MLQITKAVKEKIDLRAAITGPTGGGKTYTALRMAFAVIGNQSGKVLVIDTERKSARKYADEKPDGATWNFDVLELPDFSPSTYTEAIKLGIQSEYDVIIVDSLSHAWEGEGGILELQQKYGGRYQDWAKVNPLHFGLIDAILNAPCHMIVTMRSKMDYAIETLEDAKGNKKTQVTKVGMAPIQRNGVQYEFDFILDMDNANVGRVDKTRCSAMRGKTAAMPGPGFFKPLIDWLNSGEMPVKEVVSELQQAPAVVEQPKTNGQAAQPESKPGKSKLTRPMTPEQVKSAADVKSARFTGKPGEKQADYAFSSLNSACGKDDLKRHTVTLFLFGKESSKDLTGGECSFLIDWIGAKQENEYTPDENAVKEIEAIIAEWQRQAGQVDMFGQTEEIPF